MTREIKFRAWDKTRICMSKIFGLSEYPKFIINGYVTASSIKATSSHFSSEPKIFTSTDRFEVMQYTGLKDKNGVEIYEGDIVKHRPQTQFQCGYVTSVIKFEKGEFINCFFGSLYDNKNHCEVIGNIYENPDLLEK